jgi:hypothetical protein
MKEQSQPNFYNPDLKIRWIFAFSLVALVVFISVLYQHKNRQEDSRLWVSHAGAVITDIDTVSILFSEARRCSKKLPYYKKSGMERRCSPVT